LVDLRKVLRVTRDLNVPFFELGNGSLIDWQGRTLKLSLTSEIGDGYFAQFRVPEITEQTSVVEALRFRTAELSINLWNNLKKGQLYRIFLSQPPLFGRGVISKKIRYGVPQVSKIGEDTQRKIVDGAIKHF